MVKGPIYRAPRPPPGRPACPAVALASAGVIYSFNLAHSRWASQQHDWGHLSRPPQPAAEDRLSPVLTGAIHGPAATLPPRPRSLLRRLETLRNPVGENKPAVCALAATRRPEPGARGPLPPQPWDSKAP